MSGKAYSRAFRGYVLVYSTLHNLLLDEIITNLSEEKKSEIESAYNAYYYKEEVDDTTNVFAEIENLLAEKKARLAENNRTARLWVQLLEYIYTILLYVRAERLGDWEMYLAATHKMMNLFTATGHFHYAKSARFYLQQMLDLPSKHPEIYASFKDHGHHAIRRTDRRWAVYGLTL